MKMVDVTLILDSLILNEGETVDDVVKLINEHFTVDYDIMVDVTYEETVDD